MTTPYIPTLTLAKDSTEMGTESGESYRVPLTLTAIEPWTYTPIGRFPDYAPEIVITIGYGDGGDALCTLTAAGHITLATDPPGGQVATGSADSARQTYSWVVSFPTTGSHAETIVSPGSPLVITAAGITPNQTRGSAAITLQPLMKSLQSGVDDVVGTAATFTVEKATPPLTIEEITWSLGTRPGAGTLSWQVTGAVQHSSLTANGEPLDAPVSKQPDGTYRADMTLESNTQSVTVTACDQDDVCVTRPATFAFDRPSSFYPLTRSTGRVLTVVPSDQNSVLYTVVAGGSSGSSGSEACNIWMNPYSGTQANWSNTSIVVPPTHATSPCVFAGGAFYLLGGSLFEFEHFGDTFLTITDGTWTPIDAPPGWTEPRIGHSVTVFGGAIWVAGGFGASGTIYGDVWSYPVTGSGTWATRPALPEPRCQASLAVLGDELYLFGGYRDEPGGSVSTALHALTGGAWVDQNKKVSVGGPGGAAATSASYWAIAALGGSLRLFGSFDGVGFTGTMTDSPFWQGSQSGIAGVALDAGKNSPPFGFTTVPFSSVVGGTTIPRLFMAMASTEGNSRFSYYELPNDELAKEAG